MIKIDQSILKNTLKNMSKPSIEDWAFTPNEEPEVIWGQANAGWNINQSTMPEERNFLNQDDWMFDMEWFWEWEWNKSWAWSTVNQTEIEAPDKEPVRETTANKAGKWLLKWLWNAAEYTADIWEEIGKWLVKWTVWLAIDAADIVWDAVNYATDFVWITHSSDQEWFLDKLDEWFDKYMEEAWVINSEWAQSWAGKSVIWGIWLIAEYWIPVAWIAKWSIKWMSFAWKLLKTRNVKKELAILEKSWKLTPKAVQDLITKYSKEAVEAARKTTNMSAPLKWNMTIAIRDYVKVTWTSAEKTKTLIQQWLEIAKKWKGEYAAWAKQHPKLNKTLITAWVLTAWWVVVDIATDEPWIDENADINNTADTDGDGEEDISIEWGQEEWDNKNDEGGIAFENEDTTSAKISDSEFEQMFQAQPSIVDHLTKMWIDSSTETRSKLASAFWITDYYIGADNWEYNKALYKIIITNGLTANDLNNILLA